jgi:hypothetical protein
MLPRWSASRWHPRHLLLHDTKETDMAERIKAHFNYLLPIPPLDNDEAVLAYRRAYDAWHVDRVEERAFDRLAMIENDPEHVAVMDRAEVLRPT